MSGKKNLSEVRNAYQCLWTAFEDAANRQTLRANGEWPSVIQSDAGARTDALFVLPEWPYKSTSTKRTVDIAVRVTETFSADHAHLTHSTTQVGYFLPKATGKVRSCYPALEVHYDFEAPVQEAHPLFHVQLGKTDWPAAKLVDLGLRGAIERDTNEVHYGSVRMPTAFMGFAPALVALAADHLEPPNFRQVAEKARELHAQLANPECNYLSGKMLGGIPHGQLWYDERYVVHLSSTGKTYTASIPVLNRIFSATSEARVKSAVLTALKLENRQVQFVGE